MQMLGDAGISEHRAQNVEDLLLGNARGGAEYVLPDRDVAALAGTEGRGQSQHMPRDRGISVEQHRQPTGLGRAHGGHQLPEAYRIADDLGFCVSGRRRCRGRNRSRALAGGTHLLEQSSEFQPLEKLAQRSRSCRLASDLRDRAGQRNVVA